MGLLRAALCAGVCSLVACASLAGLEEPTEPEQIEAPTTESKDATIDAGSTSPPPPADSGVPLRVDAGADAPPACTSKQNGAVCAASVECCSERCDEAKRCVSACISPFSSCNPFDEAPCCLDHYCNGFCVPCLATGATPTARPIVGGANPKSCCSRTIGGDGLCT
jgi:hypothetical protein